jgi:HAD superfamily hydrolase (TIGR01509 family)
MIKQIWFDFGNIFIPVFPENTKEQFERCGVQLSDAHFTELHHAFEVGEMSQYEFFESLTDSCKFLQSAQRVKRAWNSMLGDLRDETLFLKKLSRSYDLALVSNTNAAHIAAITTASGPFLWTHFTNAFDGLFLSHEIHERKPNASYFEKVAKTMNAEPHEVLFIDDTQANLDGAAALGFQTLLFNCQEGNLKKELTTILAQFD